MDATTTDGPDDLLKIGQVAKRLGLRDRTIRTLVGLGHLPTVTFPGVRAVRFHPDDVAAYIESCRSKPRTTRSKPPVAAVAPTVVPTPAADGSAS